MFLDRYGCLLSWLGFEAAVADGLASMAAVVRSDTWRHRAGEKGRGVHFQLAATIAITSLLFHK